MFKKIIIFSIASCIFINTTSACCGKSRSKSYARKAKIQEQKPYPLLPKSFKPDFYITKQLPEDLKLIEEMKPLFFEADHSANPKSVVHKKAIKQHGAQEIMLLTDDNKRISSLYFKRPNAKLNLIYAPGYFFNESPTKEWAAPFALLFKEFNVLAIEWRGIGASEGKNKLLRKNAFGKNAYPDVQSAIDFMSKENNNPNVLIGFCFSAALNMYATIKAHKTGRRTADALVLNSLFTTFHNQFNRALGSADNLLNRLLLGAGLGKKILEYQANGSLFDINPIELIEEINNINIPCYFEHCTFDRFAIVQEGVEVYQTATCPKMFLQSDLGSHVRIHPKAPYQYRQAFLTFLHHVGLLA